MNNAVNIGFLIYPNMTPLDAIGPAQMLSAVPNAHIHMVWKDLRPVSTDIGITLNPTITMSDCPDLDVVCVPGGFGQYALMDDQAVLDFLKHQGEQAQYVTSVSGVYAIITLQIGILDYSPVYLTEQGFLLLSRLPST